MIDKATDQLIMKYGLAGIVIALLIIFSVYCIKYFTASYKKEQERNAAMQKEFIDTLKEMSKENNAAMNKTSDVLGQFKQLLEIHLK